LKQKKPKKYHFVFVGLKICFIFAAILKETMNNKFLHILLLGIIILLQNKWK